MFTFLVNNLTKDININNFIPMIRKVHFTQFDDFNAQANIECIPEEGEPKTVVSAQKVIENAINVAMTYRNENKAYTWEGKHHLIDINEHFYDVKTHTFPIGLISRIKRILKEQFPDIKISASNDITNMFIPPKGVIDRSTIVGFANSLHLHNDVDDFDLSPFEHQLRLVERALNGRRISLLACTSAGKSLSMMIIARYLMEREQKKVLIVVPSSNLVKQLFRDFHLEYGWKEAARYCTQIYGTSKDKLSKKELEYLRSKDIGEEATLRNITISTWQSLQHKDPSFFRVFTAVIVDEAHSTRGEKLREILSYCKNANDFKIGVSGTLPNDGLDAAYIEGAIGRKEEIVRLRELIEKGILTPVEVNSIYIPYPQQYRAMICDSSRCKYEDEFALVTNNSSRRDVMDMLIKSGKLSTAENTVILFKGLENLELMYEHLKTNHPEYQYYVIKGDISPEERETIRLAIEKSTGNVIIATYGCMQQGVNIKLLHNLVFAEPSKSPYIVVQSIGRVVRKHKDKPLARVFDFVDDASYMTRSTGRYESHIKSNRMVAHYLERCKYYEADKIPINEIRLEGYYEAHINVDDIKKKRAKAAEKATKKQSNSPYKRKFFL